MKDTDLINLLDPLDIKLRNVSFPKQTKTANHNSRPTVEIITKTVEQQNKLLKLKWRPYQGNLIFWIRDLSIFGMALFDTWF